MSQKISDDLLKEGLEQPILRRSPRLNNLSPIPKESVKKENPKNTVEMSMEKLSNGSIDNEVSPKRITRSQSSKNKIDLPIPNDLPNKNNPEIEDKKSENSTENVISDLKNNEDTCEKEKNEEELDDIHSTKSISSSFSIDALSECNEESNKKTSEKEVVKDEKVEENEEEDKSEAHQLAELETKINRLLQDYPDESEDESDTEQHPFLDTMAEEGEEGTPSDGSNDIIDVGEAINTTESEITTDDSYENDSFIADDEEHQLLSGEEYDLSFEITKKASRILQLSSGSDEEIVRINRKPKKEPKKRKKSRIVKFSDSSEEELVESIIESKVNVPELNKTVINTNEVELIDIQESEDKEQGENETNLNELVQNDIQVNGEEKEGAEISDNVPVPQNDNNLNELEKNDSEEEKKDVETFDNIPTNQNDNNLKPTKKIIVLSDVKIADPIKIELNKDKENEEINTIETEYTPINNEEQSDKVEYKQNNEQMDGITIPTAVVNVTIKKQSEEENFLIKDNITLQNVSTKRLSGQINEVIDSLISGMQVMNEVTISLAVDYMDDTELNESFSISSNIVNKKQGRKRKRSDDGTDDSNTKLKKHKFDGEPQVSKKKRKRRNNRAKSKATSEEKLTLEDKGQVNNPDLSKRRKRKRNKHKRKSNNITKPLNIVDDALVNGGKSELLQKTCSTEDISIIPSTKDKLQPDGKEFKRFKTSKKGDVNTFKFEEKDFKNMTLNDPTRVKRMDTKKLISQKRLYT